MWIGQRLLSQSKECGVGLDQLRPAMVVNHFKTRFGPLEANLLA